MKKMLDSYLYTRGRLLKIYGEIVDAENECLYAQGKYPSKITKEDLSEDYIEIRSKSIDGRTGYLKTFGIQDLKYKAMKNNHLLKDDCLYISYTGEIGKKLDCFGFVQFVNYDICICGSCMIPIILAAEKYSGIDTCQIRDKIEEKREWYKENSREKYIKRFGEQDVDLFDVYK